MQNYEHILLYIFLGTITGFWGRWWLLRADYRQYPTYPNGTLIHLTTGFIAALIGSVAIPALITKNFVAVTFLVLAIQQFRDIRKMEGNSLKDLDTTEYFTRGEAYIDGIAKTFEARNYIVMITSLFTTTTAILLKNYYFKNIFISLIIGILTLFFLKKYTQGHNIRHIAIVKQAPITFQNSDLYIGKTFVDNIGLDTMKEKISKKALGVTLIPKGDNEKVILNNEGQIKAIMHESARLLGLERYIKARRNLQTGEVALVIIPIRKEIKSLIQVIEQVPVIETNKKNENTKKN